MHWDLRREFAPAVELVDLTNGELVDLTNGEKLVPRTTLYTPPILKQVGPLAPNLRLFMKWVLASDRPVDALFAVTLWRMYRLSQEGPASVTPRMHPAEQRFLEMRFMPAVMRWALGRAPEDEDALYQFVYDAYKPLFTLV
jgi:hypothetical protein